MLFTDIVGSTRPAAEMGDLRWRALLDAHDAVVRAQIDRFRGRTVNTTGNGFLAVFDGPRRAVRCAMAIRSAVHALGVTGRAGLHTGECEVRVDDYLVIGSGLEFDDRGVHELKGVPGQWRMFAVSSTSR